MNSERKQKLLKKLKPYAADILSHTRFEQMNDYIQHGTTTVQEHVLSVADQSLKWNRKLHLHCDEKQLTRGALLHDYFLYDWHTKNHPKLHGFRHADIALKNAEEDFDLTEREKDIIKKHMWPLTLKTPMCREAWLVTFADKYVSLKETIADRLKK